MKPALLFIAISLLLTIANAKTYLSLDRIRIDDDNRKHHLIDNDNRKYNLIDNYNKKYHFLSHPTPVLLCKKVDVDDSEVSFYFKSRMNDPTLVSVVKGIKKTDFNPNRRTMFIIHGWHNNNDSAVNALISDALLYRENWNIFTVDWATKASHNYFLATGAIPGVGDVVAKFIRFLMQTTKLLIENVNLAGHSLGAHISGRVGNLFQGQIETIIEFEMDCPPSITHNLTNGLMDGFIFLAMDPALPLVDQNDIDQRLDPTDAKYVQVIHTNGDFLGILEPIGHADFYPNGGWTKKGKCAHSRSYQYFAESIIHDEFKARGCESLNDWKNGICDNNEIAYMGGNILDTKALGTFYLNTNRETPPPFALG